MPGCRSIVSDHPGLDLEIVEFAQKKGVLYFPGVLTPTEVMTAWKAGCDLVKVFPCSQIGGASYIKALEAPFPQVRFIASGGVNQNTAMEFVLAGVVAVGVGRDLIQPRAIERRERDWIIELAHRFGANGEGRPRAETAGSVRATSVVKSSIPLECVLEFSAGPLPVGLEPRAHALRWR